MSAEIPERQTIGKVSGVDGAAPEAVQIPQGETIPVPDGQVVNSINRMSAPVLGLPVGMTAEQAHAMARAQNTTNTPTDV